MSIHLARASYPLPVSRGLLWVRYGVAVFFIIIVLAQLFAFEKFGTTIGNLVPSFTERDSQVVAAIVVVLEVAALPSLLIVALSPLARVLSRVAGPLVLLLWYVLIYCGIRTAHVPNSGLLGSDINLPVNLWVLLVVMISFVVTVVVQYVDMKSQHHKHHSRPMNK